MYMQTYTYKCAPQAGEACANPLYVYVYIYTYIYIYTVIFVYMYITNIHIYIELKAASPTGHDSFIRVT